MQKKCSNHEYPLSECLQREYYPRPPPDQETEMRFINT